MVYAFLGIGFALLLLGSEAVLRGGICLSKTFGLSPLLIGLLVVSAGTSAPELIVSLQAATHGAPDLALGSVIGSNIVNTLLIFGLGALIRPMPSSPKIVWRDGGTMIVASLALLVIIRIGSVTREFGLLLLAGYAAYLVLAFITDWRRPAPLSVAEARVHSRHSETSPALSVFLMLFGLVCLFFGAHFAVDGGVTVARTFHVPEAMIGLTLVALGTSLPELATTVAASFRGHTEIASGGLIGSNIFNILLGLGLTAAIHPLAVSPAIAGADIFVMVGAAVVLVPLLASSWRLTRLQGLFLIVCYAGYIGFVAWRLGYHLPPLPGLH